MILTDLKILFENRLLANLKMHIVFFLLFNFVTWALAFCLQFIFESLSYVEHFLCVDTLLDSGNNYQV